MTKRKRDADLPNIVSKFDDFVQSLSRLIDAVPEENFSTKDVSTNEEEKVVIAKVLKRMHKKGKLSWVEQYLECEDASSTHPRETGSAVKRHKNDIAADADATFADLTVPRQVDKVWPPVLPVIENARLLKQAFTHRSHAFAMAPKSTTQQLTTMHNERLEFLGDSFLNHSVTKLLYQRFPDSREGELSLLRAELIGNATAAEFAKLYNFHEKLLLNDTAERDGVRAGAKVIADTFEAYLGALILDNPQGARKADLWLRALTEPRIQAYIGAQITEPINVGAKQKIWNHYSHLHPASAGRGLVVKYDWVDGKGGNEGGFVCACLVTVPGGKETEIGRGWGLNKKEAEHRAAMKAVEKLNL